MDDSKERLGWESGLTVSTQSQSFGTRDEANHAIFTLIAIAYSIAVVRETIYLPNLITLLDAFFFPRVLLMTSLVLLSYRYGQRRPFHHHLLLLNLTTMPDEGCFKGGMP